MGRELPSPRLGSSECEARPAPTQRTLSTSLMNRKNKDDAAGVDTSLEYRTKDLRPSSLGSGACRKPAPFSGCRGSGSRPMIVVPMES